MLIGLRKRDIPPADCPLLTTIINVIGRWSGTVALVLDDYHVIQNPKIHQGLEFILHHLPPNLKIVIASRVEPPLSLARLRACEQVMDIQLIDLQFNLEETRTYLNQVMSLGLPGVQVRQLFEPDLGVDYRAADGGSVAVWASGCGWI